LALVFGAPSAILVSACLSLVVGLMSADSRTFELLVYMFGGSAVAALSVQRVERINSFARGGVLVALTQMIVIAAFVLLSQPAPQWVEFLARLAAAVVNATVSVSLALAGYSLMAQYLGIVINHVYDGMALAQKYRLPRQIADVIPQHHGTMLVAYFYHRAREQTPAGEVAEKYFRYPGPRPQSAEAAIIMLADGTEATVRATLPTTLEELDEVMRKIFSDRLL